MSEQTNWVTALLQARRSNGTISTLPSPADEAAAYAIQHAVNESLGPIGGWKVGAAGPAAPCSAAPLPASGILPSPARLDSIVYTARLIESEIAFRLSADLPPRAAPYTAADILDAIGSCHPVIEVVQFRVTDLNDSLAKCADAFGHGALIVGEAVGDWRSRDFAALSVRQVFGEAPPLERTGNPAGDMIRLIVWLANEGAVWAGGLRAGQVITCGSWTGMTAASEGDEVATLFDGLPPVRLSFVA